MTENKSIALDVKAKEFVDALRASIDCKLTSMEIRNACQYIQDSDLVDSLLTISQFLEDID